MFFEFLQFIVVVLIVQVYCVCCVDNGCEVVVKVLCFLVEVGFCCDIDVFYFVVGVIEFVLLLMWCLWLCDVVSYFEFVVIGELDLWCEVVNVLEFVENIEYDVDMCVLCLYWYFSVWCVLISDWVEGLFMGDVVVL